MIHSFTKPGVLSTLILVLWIMIGWFVFVIREGLLKKLLYIVFMLFLVGEVIYGCFLLWVAYKTGNWNWY